MKFYGRKKEIEKIKHYTEFSKTKGSKILVVTGRRRIGKTRLIIEATKKEKRIYFFVSRKKIAELLMEWTQMIKQELNDVFLGNLTTIDELLEFLFRYSQKTPLTVIFDEFQNFIYSDKHAYSSFQKYFDIEKEDSSLFMIFSGSSISLMEKIFKGNKEPLFGRASDVMKITYLKLQDQYHFLRDKNISTGLDQIFFYSIFDGVPKYWEAVDEIMGQSFKIRFKKILMNQDWIWEEGENVLKEEFGKEYATYYSILSAISKGRRGLNEIEQYAGISDATIYLQRLEKIFGLIERKLPVTEKKHSKSRKSRWFIKDNFFKFWFAYIESNMYLKELGQIEVAADRIVAQMNQYSGRIFEKMVIRKIIEENPLEIPFTRIGNYWDRKGEVEIDVIAMNEFERKAFFFEVKMSKNKISKKIISNLISNSKKISELEDYQKFYYTVYPEKNEIKFKLIENNDEY